MLKSYLEQSSIHGLQYVGTARYPLSRYLWLVSVMCCASTAGVTIYYNISAWENSPSVVTRVTPILVQVNHKLKSSITMGTMYDLSYVQDRLAFPMLTICPINPSLETLIFGLLSDYKELIEDSMNAEFLKQVSRMQRRAEYARRVPTKRFADLILPHVSVIHELIFQWDKERPRQSISGPLIAGLNLQRTWMPTQPACWCSHSLHCRIVGLAMTVRLRTAWV